MTTSKKHVVILGAGVIGLQTALSLLQTGQYSVTVVAEHFPGDSSIKYTSPWAGGFWRSHVGNGSEDANVRNWEAETYRDWEALLKAEEAKTNWNRTEPLNQQVENLIGLGVRKSKIYFSTPTFETQPDGSGLWWKDVVSNFHILSPSDLKAAMPSAGAADLVFGFTFDTICINVPQYLLYLHQQLSSLGATFTRRKISTSDGITGVVHELSTLVPPTSSSDAGDNAIHAIVLAAGLSARSFLPEAEADKLFPIRGQTVLVKGEVPAALTHIFASKDELTYIVPRPGSGTTIIGGCKQVGDWNGEEDVELTGIILERAKGLVPGLLTGKGGGFEVVSVQVGRRPGRKGGPRLEVEKGGVEGFEGVVVHAYGHSGAGYQNSVGSAKAVVRLIEGE